MVVTLFADKGEHYLSTDLFSDKRWTQSSDQLTEIPCGNRSVRLVAFSAGVDSTFLLKAAHLALGDGAIALTASSASVPPGELDGGSSISPPA